MPQTGHGLSGTSYSVDGNGQAVAPVPIPNRYDQVSLLFDWVEKKVTPPMSAVVSAGARSLPLCSYPTYPRYVKGPPESAQSYRCAR
jgi:feruloyl esterase